MENTAISTSDLWTLVHTTDQGKPLPSWALQKTEPCKNDGSSFTKDLVHKGTTSFTIPIDGFLNARQNYNVSSPTDAQDLIPKLLVQSNDPDLDVKRCHIFIPSHSKQPLKHYINHPKLFKAIRYLIGQSNSWGTIGFMILMTLTQKKSGNVDLNEVSTPAVTQRFFRISREEHIVNVSEYVQIDIKKASDETTLPFLISKMDYLFDSRKNTMTLHEPTLFFFEKNFLEDFKQNIPTSTPFELHAQDCSSGFYPQANERLCVHPNMFSCKYIVSENLAVSEENALPPLTFNSLRYDPQKRKMTSLKHLSEGHQKIEDFFKPYQSALMETFKKIPNYSLENFQVYRRPFKENVDHFNFCVDIHHQGSRVGRLFFKGMFDSANPVPQKLRKAFKIATTDKTLVSTIQNLEKSKGSGPVRHEPEDALDLDSVFQEASALSGPKSVLPDSWSNPKLHRDNDSKREKERTKPPENAPSDHRLRWIISVASGTAAGCSIALKWAPQAGLLPLLGLCIACSAVAYGIILAFLKLRTLFPSPQASAPGSPVPG